MLTPTLTVHHLETSRSHRILWLLEELGVPYTLVTHRRDPVTRLAPPSLKQIHPLGKAPVIVHGSEVVAESGAILEYLGDCFGPQAGGELSHLVPVAGTAEHRQCRFWMQYAEGSLMNWLLMKLVFTAIPKAKMPFFVRPVARAISQKVQQQLIDPNLDTALTFMEAHLAEHRWFAGEHLTLADFQMCFVVEAALTRTPANRPPHPHLSAYLERLRERPAYRRAVDKGGPVIMSA